jgi:hypothetical protein
MMAKLAAFLFKIALIKLRIASLTSYLNSA